MTKLVLLPVYTPHIDTGDFVVAINAARIRLTGKKLQAKKYYHHTGYIGHLRQTTAGRLLDNNPEFIVREAMQCLNLMLGLDQKTGLTARLTSP